MTGCAHPLTRQKRAYTFHKAGARQRGIEFKLSFQEWLDWWQVEDRWSRRGRRGDSLVMARFGDVGAYETGNIYCTTSSQNIRDVPKAVRQKATLDHEAKRKAEGRPHPRGRSVVTPAGEFPSKTEAAEYHGITSALAAERVRNRSCGWHYKNGDPKSGRGRRPVITPAGEFASVADAARHYGIKPTTGAMRARNRNCGWRHKDT